MEDMPLNIKIENARGKINTALSEAIIEYGLPAFLISGILADVMLDVKRQEKIELTNSYNNILKVTGNEGETNSDQL